MDRIARFAPPLALMALIFFLSAQPNLSSGLGTIDLIGRKIVHMAEFGLLWLLWMRALRFRASPLLVAAGVVLYAIFDELHQHFVEGRHGAPLDVLIDTGGVAIAATLWRRYSQPRSVASSTA